MILKPLTGTVMLLQLNVLQLGKHESWHTQGCYFENCHVAESETERTKMSLA